MKWLRSKNVLAWPYEWQRPNKTEQWVYECSLYKKINSSTVQLLCFPWATLIDLIKNKFHDKAHKFIEALNWVPPKSTLKRITVMQHIWAMDMLPYLIKLGVTDVYWSHAKKNETLISGIKIHPYPLYPVCWESNFHEITAIPSDKRKYLYSFIGAYDHNIYLTNVRQLIFDLPVDASGYVVRRSEWHYQSHVYQNQIFGEVVNQDKFNNLTAHENQYRKILGDSIFSLCPSGSGPNTIRLWESLGGGCIPVIMSDNIRLPGDHVEWESAALFVSENVDSVRKLPFLLKDLSRDVGYLNDKQNAAINLWNRHIKNNELPC